MIRWRVTNVQELFYGGTHIGSDAVSCSPHVQKAIDDPAGGNDCFPQVKVQYGDGFVEPDQA